MTTSSISSPSRAVSPRSERAEVADTASSNKRPAGSSQPGGDARLDGLQARSPDASAEGASAKRPRTSLLGADSGIAAREAKLDKVYTPLSLQARQTHAANQKRLDAGVQKLLQNASVQAEIAAGKDVRDCVADALKGLLEEAQLSTDIYQPKDATQLAGYGRYLLHSHAKEGESFCLQLFAFDARQKTPIHDHPNECASFILKGNLSERIYRPTGETKDNTPLAEKTERNARTEASWAGFGPDELGVPHSLKNKSGDIALSVHLYRDMDGLSEGQQIAAKTKFERTPKAPKPAVALAE